MEAYKFKKSLASTDTRLFLLNQTYIELTLYYYLRIRYLMNK